MNLGITETRTQPSAFETNTQPSAFGEAAELAALHQTPLSAEGHTARTWSSEQF